MTDLHWVLRTPEGAVLLLGTDPRGRDLDTLGTAVRAMLAADGRDVPEGCTLHLGEARLLMRSGSWVRLAADPFLRHPLVDTSPTNDPLFETHITDRVRDTGDQRAVHDTHHTPPDDVLIPARPEDSAVMSRPTSRSRAPEHRVRVRAEAYTTPVDGTRIRENVQVTLSVTSGPLVGRSFCVSPTFPCGVGTDPGCFVRLPSSDPEVRGQHAIIEFLLDVPQIRSLGRSCPVYVNGALVVAQAARPRSARRALRDGDAIRIGQTVLIAAISRRL